MTRVIAIALSILLAFPALGVIYSKKKGATELPDQSSHAIAIYTMNSWCTTDACTQAVAGGSCGSGCTVELENPDSVTIDNNDAGLENTCIGAAGPELVPPYYFCTDANCGALDITGTSLTFGCGIYIGATEPSGTGAAISKGDSTTGYGVLHTGNSDAQCQFASSTLNSTGAQFGNGAGWQNVACKYVSAAGTDSYLYIDGSLDNSKDGDIGPSATTSDFRILQRANGAAPFDDDGGVRRVDYCWVYQGELSDAEICYVNECGWDNRFGCDCTGSTINDSSGRGTSCSMSGLDCADPITD